MRASIIIPTYESQETVAATLHSLRQQTERDFETILVDSGETDAVQQIVKEFPEVRYSRAPERLYPHAARNVGVQIAQGDLFIFTDPDIVAAPEWLEKLLRAYEQRREPIVGAVASLQRDWMTLGIHLAKFDSWLPGGQPRAVAIAPTVNFLCSREVFEETSGFAGQEMLGDTLFSWELEQLGHSPYFEPNAIVHHDHRNTTFGGLIRERYVRGGDFGRLRASLGKWGTMKILAVMAASIFPFRLVKLAGRALRHSINAGCTLDGFRTMPIVICGHAAWLAGEISQYFRLLRAPATKKEELLCAS